MESTDSRWISVEGSKRIVTIAVAPCTGQTVEKSYLPLTYHFNFIPPRTTNLMVGDLRHCYLEILRGLVKSPISSKRTCPGGVAFNREGGKSIFSSRNSTDGKVVLLSFLPVVAKNGNRSSPTAIDRSSIDSSQLSFRSGSSIQRCD